MGGKSTKTTNFSARIPNDVLARLRQEAEERGVSVATRMIELLEVGWDWDPLCHGRK